MAAPKRTKHVLVTGLPGVGKTTLCRKVFDALKEKGIQVHGFYTQEVRGPQRGNRIGFDVITLDGKQGPLSRVRDFGEDIRRNKHMPSVGNYLVDVQSFEQLALPALQTVSSNHQSPVVYLVDEIGKMELFSQSFVEAVRRLFDLSAATVLASVPVARQKRIPFVEEIKRRTDVTLIEVTKSNRDALVDEVLHMMLNCVQQSVGTRIRHKFTLCATGFGY